MGGLGDGRVPLERLHVAQYPTAPVAGQVVDEEQAAQVVGLVLQAPGEEAGAADLDGLPVLSTPRTVADSDRSSSWYGPGTDRQPSSCSILRATRLDRRVDNVADVPLAALVRAIVDEHGQVDPDLRGREPDALGDVEGREHVARSAGQVVVEGGNRAARVMQHGVADHADLGDLQPRGRA